MNDSNSNFLRNLLMWIVLIAGVAMVVIGQKHIGAPGLGLMLLGLAALIGLLWFYNRKYR
ncbi:DUF6903 family protein [Paenibacillus pini]|uniref:Uncharacterized protein n=2 Tax=Paenibacillus TaxID=44249 RepID=W7YUY9_9BACL|nr:hypothetical protein JCM16418_2480 [Paenibacillus pini JCM 16418]